MTPTLYLLGFIATMTLAGFARSEKNYSEMRTLLATAVLFFCLAVEKMI